jgi:CelD/BcsL family acetyltransferase involved in cellulose biosynthesis
MLARYSGNLIAGITLRFFQGGLVEFSNHSSLDEFLNLKPNDLLQWKCIEWACAEGFRRCSLGGAHTFHRRFGGMIIPIFRYRLDRTLLRRHDRQERAFDFIRKGFHKLPEPLQTLVRRMR